MEVIALFSSVSHPCNSAIPSKNRRPDPKHLKPLLSPFHGCVLNLASHRFAPVAIRCHRFTVRQEDTFCLFQAGFKDRIESNAF